MRLLRPRAWTAAGARGAGAQNLEEDVPLHEGAWELEGQHQEIAGGDSGGIHSDDHPSTREPDVVGPGGGLRKGVSFKAMQQARLDVPLRGVFTGEVVRMFKGADGDIHRSRLKDTLDAFLSHSWRGSWWQKSIAVVLYSYFPLAMLLALLIQLLLGLLMVPGTPVSEKPVCMPYMTDHLAEVKFCRTPGHMYVSGLSMLGCFLAHRLVPTWLGRLFFLDKGCIDQSNPTAIAKGVSSLGGVLRNCSAFVLLWTDDYFTRLWCIFELACFMHFGGHEGSTQLVLIPVILPVFVAFGNLYILSVWAMFDGVIWLGLYEWLAVQLGFFLASVLMALAVASPLFLGFMYVARSLARLREDLVKAMSEFQTEAADVAQPDDRAKIEECIRHWYGDVATFDEFVRGPLLDMLREQLGSRVLAPYWSVVAFAFPSLVRALEHAILANWNAVLFPLGYALIINPIFLLVIQWCLQQQDMPKCVLIIGLASLTLLWGSWAVFIASVPAHVGAIVFVAMLLPVLYAYQPQASELYFLGFRRSQRRSVLPPRYSFQLGDGLFSQHE